MAVFLQDSYIGQVLDDVVRLLGGDLFAAFRPGVHADVVAHACQRRDVAQFGGVDEDLRADREGVAALHQRRAPAAGLLREGEQPGVEADFQRLLLRGDLLQDGVSDRRFEEHIADPSRAEAVGTSVMGGQRVAELPEKSALEPVVAVDGAYARRGEHAPEPGGLLDEQHARAHAGGGDARGRSGGSAPDDQQVVTGVRPAAGEQRGGAQYR